METFHLIYSKFNSVIILLVISFECVVHLKIKHSDIIYSPSSCFKTVWIFF